VFLFSYDQRSCTYHTNSGKFIRSLKTRNVLRSMSALLSNFLLLGEDVVGFKILANAKGDLVDRKLASLGEDEQHPVIPPRIFSNLLNELFMFLSEIQENIANLEAFLEKILSEERFARSVSMQRKLGYSRKQFGPHFDEAAEQYQLCHIFKKYAVTTLPKLSSFLTRIQHGCRLYIHIYTGMRNAEALSLKLGCLRRSNGYRILGETSKLIGQRKAVSWVTTNDVVTAIDIAESLARIVGKFIKLDRSKTPLFISMGYLGFSTAPELKADQIIVNNAGTKRSEVYSYLDTKQFEVTDSDLDHLAKVNPFRAWESEQAFAIGRRWRFTTHQFRRSLAFYVAQSALVSLPSLKRQLKHIGREMTLYYCQTKELEADFKSSEHFSRILRDKKPEADAIAYIHDLLMSQDALHGAHGKFVEKNVKPGVLLNEARGELIKQFKKGELAYKETPLGACTTLEPCDKKAMREIAACVSCERAVIKLKKLDYVIEQQQAFIDTLNEYSVEHRSEMAELAVLQGFRKRIGEMGGVNGSH